MEAFRKAVDHARAVRRLTATLALELSDRLSFVMKDNGILMRVLMRTQNKGKLWREQRAYSARFGTNHQATLSLPTRRSIGTYPIAAGKGCALSPAHLVRGGHHATIDPEVRSRDEVGQRTG